MLKSLALLLPPIRRLYEQRNVLLARVAELDGALREQREKFGEAAARLCDDMQARFGAIESRFNGVEHALQHHTNQLGEIGTFASMHFPMRMLQQELQLRDLIDMQLAAHPLPTLGWTFNAERILAADTNDHLFPRGTRNDNTRHPGFVRACEASLGGSLRHLDLGCAGGGLIWDFTRRGHASVGVEGQ